MGVWLCAVGPLLSCSEVEVRRQFQAFSSKSGRNSPNVDGLYAQGCNDTGNLGYSTHGHQNIDPDYRMTLKGPCCWG